MLRKFFGCLLALGWSLFPATHPGVRQAAAAEIAAPDLLTELLENGIKLERDHRWQEAIQQYEKLLRKFPEQPDVERRLQIVRVHFDVVRRYGDKSFVQTVDRTSPAAALDLLGEVMTKLQAYYVEPIDLARLLRNGTAFLEVALTEESFLKENISPTVRAEVIEHFRTNIHKSVLGRPVANIQEARAIVSQVATMARDQIGLTPTSVIYEYVAGFIGLLDPYSAYLTAGEYREIMSQIEGNLIGLGVELWAEGDELRIVEVFRGGPAAEAGLMKDDLLTEIGGVRVADVGAKRAADLLRGPESSTVRLIYDRPSVGLLECTVRRRRVDVPSVSDVAIVDATNGIGYLRISNFQRTTVAEVDEALKQLYGQGLKSLIIDLRRNPGGLLDSAVEIADRFLYTGPIVSTRGRNGQENRNYHAKSPGTWELPLMVMIDEDSASASEIFAGAIRDQNRGLIVGRTSYGKGSVQGVFQHELAEGGMRLTISKFFSPAGHAISARGITPHIEFADPRSNLAAKPVVDIPSASKVPVSLNASAAIAQVPSGPASSGSQGRRDKVDIDLQRAIETARTELPKIARSH